MEEHPAAESGENSNGYPVRGATDRMPQRVADEEADDRHRHFDASHEQADLEPLAARQSAHPERGSDGERVEAEWEDE